MSIIPVLYLPHASIRQKVIEGGTRKPPRKVPLVMSEEEPTEPATPSYQYDGVWKEEGNKESSTSSMWKWRHPELGEFYHDENTYGRTGDWVSSESPDASSFRTAFHLNPAFRNVEGFEELTTKPPRPPDHLIDRAVRLKRMLLEEGNMELQRKIAKAMWDDWHGDFENGMWWSGELDDVKEAWEECPEPFPTGPKDIEGLVEISTLRVNDKVSIMAEFGFNCAYFIDVGISEFEPEHSIGVEMTADDEVDGLGYSLLAI